MEISRYVFFYLLIISSGITCILALLAQKRNKSHTSKLFSYLLLTITTYSCGYAFELISNSLSKMLFWSHFQYLGIVLIPPLWFILAFLYNGLEKWLTKPLILSLFVIPVLTLIVRFTNIHLFYTHLSIDNHGFFPVFAPIKGPWYWVNIVYLDSSLLIGLLVYIIMGRKATVIYRRQTIIISIAVIFPWLGHFISLTPYSQGLDFGSLALCISAIVSFWGFNVFHLCDIIPIARSKVFESLRDGVFVIDLQNRIVDSNAAMNQILKLEEKSLGINIAHVLKNYPALLKQLLAREEQAVIQINGKEQYYESRLYKITEEFNHTLGYTVILTDQSEQIILLNRLQKLATIDSLTNVFNRRYFFEVCHEKLLHLPADPIPDISFILIDLDYFKDINDTYGHQVGDIVLHETSANLIGGLSGQGILGRVGGEEFAILLPELSAINALSIAEHLRKSIAKRISLDGFEIQITASFGVSCHTAISCDLDLLFSQADLALYYSKNSGRNKVTVYNSEIGPKRFKVTKQNHSSEA